MGNHWGVQPQVEYFNLLEIFFIKKILICVSKMNESLIGFERHYVINDRIYIGRHFDANCIIWWPRKKA